METVRGILAAHPNGISRAGILAWAKLRIDPDFDEPRLDAELAALGGEVVEQDGFLWLGPGGSASRQAAESATRRTPGGGAATAGAWTPPAPPNHAGGGSGERGEEGGIVGWRAPGVPPEAGTATEETTAWTTEADPGTAVAGTPGWTPPMRRTARTGGWIFGLVVVAVIVVSNLVGYLTGDRSSDTSPTGPASSLTGSTGPVEDLSVGDCIGFPTADEFSELLFVPCDSPHDAEVFLVGDHPAAGGGYPDETAFESWVKETCYPAFEDYTGSALDDQSVLDVGWFTPTESSWRSGDRVVHCYLAPADGTTTSVSWRGANP